MRRSSRSESKAGSLGQPQQLLLLARQALEAALGEKLVLTLHRQLILELLPVAFAGREAQPAVVVEFGADAGLAQATVETAQDLLIAHVVVEHHRHRLGQLAATAEQQRLAAGLADGFEGIEPL